MKILYAFTTHFAYLSSLTGGFENTITNLRSMSLAQFVYVIDMKLKRKLRKHLACTSYSIPDEKFINRFSCSNNEDFVRMYEKNLREKFFFNSSEKDEIIDVFKKNYNVAIPKIISKSDDYCDHIFDLLGSGKVKLGKQIDWHLDFKSGFRWDENEKYIGTEKHINLQDSSDVKIPLELNRCQHFVNLGKAYWITGNEKYAQEFVDEVENWIENNPVGFGVNWACPMDVAIRAVNWIWGYCFFMDSKSLTNKFKLKILKNLYFHGKFIFDNLEVGWMRGNHFLSDITGLIFLGILFPKCKDSNQWFKLGYKALVKEINYQVHNDGVDFEASIGYHRLVTELILCSVLLLKKNSIEVPDFVLKQLEKMIEFVMYYTKPDGKCPVIGDADNGRLQILSDDDINDHRHLLSIGAVLFRRKDFKNVYNKFNEEAFWLLGVKGLKTFEKLPPQQKTVASKYFRDGGYYIMRKDDLYMNIRCGDVGLAGHGGHGHCDCLSFELFAKDKTFIIDPGSYVYTADTSMRSLFRSTKYHNTLVVDGKEINRFKKDKLFELFAMKFDAIPKLNTWEVTDKYDVFDGEHAGYQRLEHPVTHRRKILFNKKEQRWTITDMLTGKGKHLFEWYFHFAPLLVEQKKKNPLLIRTKCNDTNIQIVPNSNSNKLHCEILDGWVSYSYGKKEKAPIIKYELNSNLDENDVIMEFAITVVE